MGGAEDTEVTLVKGENARDAESFGHRRDRTIHPVNTAIGVLLHDVSSTRKVRRCGLDKGRLLLKHRANKGQPGRIPYVAQYHVGKLW